MCSKDESRTIVERKRRGEGEKGTERERIAGTKREDDNHHLTPARRAEEEHRHRPETNDTLSAKLTHNPSEIRNGGENEEDFVKKIPTA